MSSLPRVLMRRIFFLSYKVAFTSHEFVELIAKGLLQTAKPWPVGILNTLHTALGSFSPLSSVSSINRIYSVQIACGIKKGDPRLHEGDNFLLQTRQNCFLRAKCL